MHNQDFAKRGERKVNFFAQTLSDLGSVLNKLIQLKRVNDCGRGPGGVARAYERGVQGVHRTRA